MCADLPQINVCDPVHQVVEDGELEDEGHHQMGCNRREIQLYTVLGDRLDGSCGFMGDKQNSLFTFEATPLVTDDPPPAMGMEYDPLTETIYCYSDVHSDTEYSQMEVMVWHPLDLEGGNGSDFKLLFDCYKFGVDDENACV